MEDDEDTPPELVLVDDAGDDVITSQAADAQLGSMSSSSAPADEENHPLIPLTLLTGFLGSGKTTLLNYIMTADHGYRVAVCMNDFGDTTDIESTAMTFSGDPSASSSSAPQTSFLSLPNGCLCCSIKEPGIAAIEDMVIRAQSDGRGVDWVVVELTGLADPAEIARTFWTNEEMGGRLRLDGVIGVADARNLVEQLTDIELRGQCERQLAASDLVILNKTDLVTVDEAQEATRIVRSINGVASVLQTQRSVVDVGRLFPLNVYSSSSAAADSSGSSATPSNARAALAWASLMEQEPSIGDSSGPHSHTHTHADALSDVKTLTARVRSPLSPTARQLLERFLESLHWDRRLPPGGGGTAQQREADDAAAAAEQQQEEEEIDVLRSKGMFLVDGGDADGDPRRRRIEILQGVRDMFEIRRLFADDEEMNRLAAEQGGGKLVVIGRGLGTKEAFQEALDRALMAAQPAP